MMMASSMDSNDLITSEGTKIKISEKALKLAEEQRRRESMHQQSTPSSSRERQSAKE